MKHGETLVVFFKSPVVGQVKTRLAADLGPEKTLLVYEKLLELNLQLAGAWKNRDPEKRKLVLYRYGAEYRLEVSELHHCKRQWGQDLGLKMENALREELTSAEKVCIIGTDAHDLSLEILESAYEQLTRWDVVLGPAFDGGFYLIGARQTRAGMLSQLNWSVESTRSTTLNRCRGFHLKTTTDLPLLRDIDTLRDLEAANFCEEIWRNQ